MKKRAFVRATSALLVAAGLVVLPVLSKSASRNPTTHSTEYSSDSTRREMTPAVLHKVVPDDSAALSVTSAIRSVAVSVSGTFNDAPNTDLSLEFFFRSNDHCICVNPPPPQCVAAIPFLLAEKSISTDVNGEARFSFTLTLPAPIPSSGGFIGLRATNPTTGNIQGIDCIPITSAPSSNTSNLNTTSASSGIIPADSPTGSAVSSSIVAGTFFGAPDKVYGISFFFTPAGGGSCSTDSAQSLNSLPLPIKTDHTGVTVFSITLPTPLGDGFINAKASSQTRDVSFSSPCVSLIKPSCPPSISPANKNFDIRGGSDTFNVAALLDARPNCNCMMGCNSWTAQSNAGWITITSFARATDSTAFGSVSYSVSPNTSGALRIGTIDISGQPFTIVQGEKESLTPTVTSACKGVGKQLIIMGSSFADGAKVFLNGGAEKTTFVSSTQVIAFKAGKRAVTGDTLKVRNPDSNETPEFTYTRVNCSP